MDSFYAGLASEPALIYGTDVEKWGAPSGPEAQRRLRKLYPVFGHVINKVWNDDLGGRVVDVLDTPEVR